MGASSKKTRDERKAAGLCIHCGKQPSRPITRCDNCWAKEKALVKRKADQRAQEKIERLRKEQEAQKSQESTE